MIKYQAVINVPGYLPMDDEVHLFDSVADAWEWLADERERDLDATEDVTDDQGVEAQLLEARDKPGTVYLSTPGYDGDHDLGLAYTVVPVNEAQVKVIGGWAHGKIKNARPDDQDEGCGCSNPYCQA